MSLERCAQITALVSALGGCETAAPIRPVVAKPAESTANMRAFADRDKLLAHCSREILDIVGDCANFGRRCEVAFPNSVDADPNLLQQFSHNVAFGCKTTLDSNALRDSMRAYEEGLNKDADQDPCPDASEGGQCIR